MRMEFSQMKSVYIIGGGSSLEDFDFSKLQNKDTIAVNKSILDVSDCNYFVTMDHSIFGKVDKFKRDLKKYSCTKVFIANFCKPYMIEKNGQIIDSRWNLIYDLSSFDIIVKSRNVDTFGRKWNDFRNGNNSGYCAIQLAILLGYKEINLLGFDLQSKEKKTHYHKGYNESVAKFNTKLEEYYTTLKRALLEWQMLETDVKIYSCSQISRLNNILPYKEIE